MRYRIVLRIVMDFIADSSRYDLVFGCAPESGDTGAFILLRGGTETGPLISIIAWGIRQVRADLSEQSGGLVWIRPD